MEAIATARDGSQKIIPIRKLQPGESIEIGPHYRVVNGKPYTTETRQTTLMRSDGRGGFRQEIGPWTDIVLNPMCGERAIVTGPIPGAERFALVQARCIECEYVVVEDSLRII